ncbi:hypothetical protein [Leptospira sp. GIMC2001]|uniref:hypothetical protein n=1 Tax=Leptospira sp. GIMC2001 TaxID=1513297 RepID=UPI002349ECC6|nr:hypothetical protein [Leptospira sp. GIMC2001]WCL49121.1 hypothetical protein O4O04_17795 [Leptospira sp. GIMC2001]
MSIINRSALLVFHKKPLIDWQNEIYPTDLMEYEDTMKSHDHAHVYLTPEFDFEDEFNKWLQKNYKIVFEDILSDWCTDDKLWPKNLSFKLFGEWFHFIYQSMVIDTLESEIERDED